MGVGEVLTVRQIQLAQDRGEISAAWCEGAAGGRWIALAALQLPIEPEDA